MRSNYSECYPVFAIREGCMMSNDVRRKPSQANKQWDESTCMISTATPRSHIEARNLLQDIATTGQVATTLIQSVHHFQSKGAFTLQPVATAATRSAVAPRYHSTHYQLLLKEAGEYVLTPNIKPPI